MTSLDLGVMGRAPLMPAEGAQDGTGETDNAPQAGREWQVVLPAARLAIPWGHVAGLASVPIRRCRWTADE